MRGSYCRGLGQSGEVGLTISPEVQNRRILATTPDQLQPHGRAGRAEASLDAEWQKPGRTGAGQDNLHLAGASAGAQDVYLLGRVMSDREQVDVH